MFNNDNNNNNKYYYYYSHRASHRAAEVKETATGCSGPRHTCLQAATLRLIIV